MKPKHLALLLAGVAVAAIIAALVVPDGPRPSGIWIGTAQNETNWPFRYVISRRGGNWHGKVERRTDNDWKNFDEMDIYEQSKDRLRFKTHVDETGNLSSQSWLLTLGEFDKDSQRRAGILTNDGWDNRAVSISFRPVGSM